MYIPIDKINSNLQLDINELQHFFYINSNIYTFPISFSHFVLKLKLIDWLIVYCLMSVREYFTRIETFASSVCNIEA